MGKLVLALLAGSCIVAATPASAAFVLNGDGSLSISSDTAIGSTYTVNFDGSSSGAPITGLTSSLVLTFNGASGSNWQFGYDLTNTSGAPLTSSNVMAFGFDSVTSGLLSGTVSGGFGTVASGSISNGMNVDICFKNGQGNNCAGGGNTGFGFGETSSGTFGLNYANNLTGITLDNFVVRYQSINGNGIQGGSGVGVPTGAVPEPATWAMMIMGFGLIGAGLRSSKRQRRTLSFT